MAKLKVAIVSCALPPEGGGIGNNAYYQAVFLSRLGWEITVFTPDYPGIKKINPSGFQIRYLSGLTVGKAGWLFSLSKELADFQLIHLYYPFFGSDLIVARVKKKNPQKKLILHYQMDPIGQGAVKIFFSIYLKFFLSKLLEAADKIAVLSRDHAEHSRLAGYYFRRPEKFFELPNGISAELFSPGKKDPELLAELGLNQDDRLAVFVGGLDARHFFKGLEVLFKAAAELSRPWPKFRLLIVGGGGWLEKYRRLAKELGLADKVVFAGWVANQELPRYYRLGDIFVLPSTAATESFGIAIAEAQACGLPAVVSDWPGSRSTLEPFKTGLLVKPGRPDDLAEKIERLLRDRKLAEEMGERAGRQAREKYDWSALAEKISRLYKKLLNENDYKNN